MGYEIYFFMIPILTFLTICTMRFKHYSVVLVCSHEPDAIFLRSINEVEVKPKPKAIPAAAPP